MADPRPGALEAAKADSSSPERGLAIEVHRHTCPVCGMRVLDVQPYATWPPPVGVPLHPPYCVVLGAPSYEVCSVCAFEFGFDDDPGGHAAPMTFAEYRSSWEADGRPLFADGQLIPSDVVLPWL